MADRLEGEFYRDPDTGQMVLRMPDGQSFGAQHSTGGNMPGWLPGWSGEQSSGHGWAANKLLEDMKKVAPSGYLNDYRQGMFRQMQTPIGAGYQNTELYRNLLGDMNAMLQQRGQRTGASHASRGMAGGAKVGASLRAGTQQTTATARALTGVNATAEQAHARAQMQHFDRLLKGAGFEKGMMDADFQQKYMQFLLQQGLSDREAAERLANMQAALGIVGGVATTAATLYANRDR